MSRRTNKPDGGQNTNTRPAKKGILWSVVGAIVIVALGAYAAYRTAPASSPSSVSQESETLPAGSPFAATIANQAAAPTPAPEGMVWIPGGEFSMGSTIESGVCGVPGLDARRAADPPRLRRRLLDGRDRGDQRAVRAVRRRDGLRDHRRADADAKRTSPPRRRRTWSPAPRSSRRRRSPVRSTITTSGGATCTARTGAIRRARERSHGAREVSRRAHRLRGRRRLREVGRANACRPRPSGSSPRAAAWRASSTPGATS